MNIIYHLFRRIGIIVHQNLFEIDVYFIRIIVFFPKIDYEWKYIENSNNGLDEIRIDTIIHQNR